jgi:putative peptidoglycan lipid II flippase
MTGTVDRQPTSAATGIAGAATLIAIGNVASRLLGLMRETTIAFLFGATGMVSAFDVASRVPRMIFDLLIDGMVSSALVPVFSDLVERDREELWQVVSILLSIATVFLGICTLTLELLAPQIAWLMSGGFDQELLDHTAFLMRLTSPAVIFLSLSGILTGLLYAMKRFTLPAFTSAMFNATIVVVAFVLTGVFHWGIESLAVGMVLGATMQVLLQLPGLRGSRLRPSFNWRHPRLRRILRLYAPVVLGLVISQIGIVIDRNLASRTGEQSIAWMRYATTLVQLPIGLVSAAIAMATLPTLSRLASQFSKPIEPGLSQSNEQEQYMSTLASGLKMVLLLILPSVAGLYALSVPVVSLLFQHGDFTAIDTQQTAAALRLYLLGTAFAAIDLPLVFAFYARQNTLTPALVGVAGVLVYLLAAFFPTLFRPLRMTDLVLANSIQLASHALIMLFLTHKFGSLRNRALGISTIKGLFSATAMGIVVHFLSRQLVPHFPGHHLHDQLAVVGVAGGAGVLLYAFLAMVLRVEGTKYLVELARKTVRFNAKS